MAPPASTLSALVWVAVAAGLAGAASAASPAPAFHTLYAIEDAAQLTEWGRRYEHGEGVKQDIDRAIQLYCKAAGKGSVAAQYYLGYLYAHGRGVPRDDALAAAWFSRAARRGDPPSAQMLKILRVTPAPRAECRLSRPPPAAASPARMAQHPARGPIADLVRRLAPEYGLDANLVLAVIEAESNFDPAAVSPKNAQGLMQLIPETAARFGVTDVWEPEQNLRGGMAYLSWLLKRFNGDIRLALAGYNAGEQAVERHAGIPPFDETQRYVERITRRLGLVANPDG